MDDDRADCLNAGRTMPSVAAVTALQAALTRHSRTLPQPVTQRLSSYCEQLWEWNTRINLTRHVDYETFVARDLADSLALAQYLAEGERILDVGTGGGVPGVVLAIVRPDLQVAVCESVQKKARCVEQIVSHLGIPVAVFAERAERVLVNHAYQTLTIRGVARLDLLLRSFRESWSSFDRMLLVKGPRWVEERGMARHRGLLQPLELRKLCEYSSGSATSVILQLRQRAG